MADIVDTANQAGSFNNLVNAVKAAGLLDTLKGPGPFTLFAPTDEAFEDIPQNILNQLMQNTDMLKQVLLYHIVDGEYTAEDVMEEDELMTLGGQELTVDTTMGVMVNDAEVMQPDIECDNGIIHVIDKVLIPSRVASQISM